eukprot:scaffold243058_cov17-Tisochrysis_lutea.AAC.1
MHMTCTAAKHAVGCAGEGAFATVNLCELLPGVQCDRSFSSPADPDENTPAQQTEADTKDGYLAEQQAGSGQLVAVKCLKPVRSSTGWKEAPGNSLKNGWCLQEGLQRTSWWLINPQANAVE